MDSTVHSVIVADGLPQRVRGILETLQNLVHLTRVDADDPTRVRAYADESDQLLVEIYQHISTPPE